MVRENCIDTMLNPPVSASLSPTCLSLTWRGWFRDGKRLLAVEVLRALSLGSVWVGRARSRHQLGALDARLLADIGKTHQEQLSEAQKPFWRS